MKRFFSLIIAALASHIVNGWLEPYVEVSIKAMLVLITFIAVYMASNRYIKQFLD